MEHGINRNIVECKYCICAVLDIDVFRINRNIVECKYSTDSIKNNSNPVLIETLWNVNVLGYGSLFRRRFVLIETLWNVNSPG